MLEVVRLNVRRDADRPLDSASMLVLVLVKICIAMVQTSLTYAEKLKPPEHVLVSSGLAPRQWKA